MKGENSDVDPSEQRERKYVGRREEKGSDGRTIFEDDRDTLGGISLSLKEKSFCDDDDSTVSSEV